MAPIRAHGQCTTNDSRADGGARKGEAMSETRMKQGGFGWNELMTKDVAAAKKFYGKLFGWKTEEAKMDGGTYTIVKVGREMVGGMMETPPECKGTPPHWGAYVTVDDVEATAAMVKRLRGKVLTPPTDIPEVGRFCVFQDPQGAALCAITWKPPAKPASKAKSAGKRK
jgi:uncharacterized protein